ncbi:[protein-PII] uridylyltransferase [Streptomyces sp. OF3]|uniref:Bifunctional uridylyltransferase/uridylyl-removing enzyme n=1 Tax=Streptomyces alkaliterrae TaxID=2213162 RepID=A0A7W3WQW1_9ACTN|nr:[protein-PII] uridylyltransferase [Streptomyces alkaliterrae]MBB1256868.1 [protein-PII] uridylyltransferase [Streptomyces alkaliterrae]
MSQPTNPRSTEDAAPDTPDSPDATARPGYAADRVRLLGSPTGGAPRRAELAGLTDLWLAGLLGPPRPGVALVAVGGYGRRELSPRSDLDLLLLHDGRLPGAELAALADRLWYPVWDQGLALDHSVRTPEEARRTAADDLKVQLGLLDARHVAGDAGLTARLRTELFGQWRSQAATRLPELEEMCRERARRHGELQYLLEGDLKEARGGLRDATALRAVAASWLADAPREGLEHARARLLDTRDALQLTTGRATDRLSLHDQDQVAAALGLLDADALLRQVNEAARTISYAADVTWREVNRVLRARRSGAPRLRQLLGGARRPTGPERTPLADGVVEQEGEAVLALGARPEKDATLVLRAAAAAAQSGLPLALATARRLAAVAPNLPTPWPAEAREEFVTLLGAGEATVPVWEALEAEGLITALLPDWERVRCRPQRNAVHRWTVDRHLVETAVRASALTRRVHRPDLLLVGALLHDIGKGWPGDHSVVGETIARDMAARMGFPAPDVSVLGALVRHHLLLVDTATRRDLDDPATVAAVAEAVGDTGTLELLHALTEADALATGPGAWSVWRGSLVAELVRRAAAALAGGSVPAATVERAPTAESERLAVEARRVGGPVLTLHAREEGPRTPDEPAEDATSIGVELLVALPERAGALSAAAGVLALHRLTVRSADVRTLDPLGTGPVTVLSWRVAAEYGSLPQADRLRVDLVRALEGTLDVPARLAEREQAYRGRRRGLAAPPPAVSIAPGSSRTATVIEVRAQDASGLLHRIGRALEEAGAVVRSAHISTLGANAVDAFYVTDAKGEPLEQADAEHLARTLERALAP